MRNILSKKDLRQLEILELLLDLKWRYLNDISQTLGIKYSTLRKDIEEINDFIYPAVINTARDNGANLSIPNTLSKSYIYLTLLNKSLEFQILEEIFFHEYSNMLELADHFYISESTLKRIVKRMNTNFKKIAIEIQIGKDLKLKGNIQSIINMMLSLIREKYNCLEDKFSDNEISFVQKVIKEFFEENSTFFNYKRLSYSKINQIETHMLVVIQYKKIYGDIHLTHHKVATYLNFKTDMKTLHFNTKLSQKDLEHIFVNYIDYIYSDDTKILDLLAKIPDIDYLNKEIREMLTFISTHLDLPCPNINQISFSLISDLVIASQPRFILLDKDKDFFKQLPIAYQDLTIFLKNLFKDIGLTSERNIEKISFLDLIILWDNLALKLEQMVPKLTAGIFLDAKLKGLEFFKKFLERYFKDKFEFVIITNENLTKIDKLNLTCIITDFPEVENIIGSSVPIITMSYSPSPTDLEKLIDFYNACTSAED